LNTTRRRPAFKSGHARPTVAGIDTDAGSAGAPVFDAAGRLTGVAVPGNGEGRMLFSSVAALRTWINAPPAGAATPAARVGADEIYERALRSALQLIATR
jgi:hypothetical protein